MSDVMIRVENLGKRYVIGHQFEGAGYVTLRDRLSDGARSLMNRRNIARSPGMSRSPIKAKFDEIGDFAEVERFLATPVECYSSGM
jgi:lipopolysaccharide transport system ATP-binding protein